MTYAPDAARGRRRMFVRGLEVRARLGVLPHEHEAAQRVVIDVELLVEDADVAAGVGEDRLSRVPSYAVVADRAREAALAGHTWLAETLAERIAVAALADPRVVAASVTVTKPDIIGDAAAVGVTVERRRDPRHHPLAATGRAILE